jgi:hypothetical protein
MPAADEVRRVDVTDRDGDLPRRVRAVDEGVDAAGSAALDDFPDRQHERCATGDLADHDQACSAGQAVFHGAGDPIGTGRGERDACGDDADSGAGGDALEFVHARGVLVIGHDDLIARTKVDVREHGAQRDGRVGHGGQAHGVGVDEPPERVAGLIHEPFEVHLEEPHRLALHAGADLGVLKADGLGHRSV